MTKQSDQDPIQGAPPVREVWSSRAGFVLASAGSAVGLGNIWKFPYITGMNGGGYFVLVYLVCIAMVGLPVMIAEVLVGRAAQSSTVPAYEKVSGGKLAWSVVGWMGVLTGFVLLSYYSVVAGWTIDYIKLALAGSFEGVSSEEVGTIFNELSTDFAGNVQWHTIFMIATVAVVVGGVQRGIELGARIMMPALLLMMLILVAYAATRSGFGEAARFVFMPDSSRPLDGAGALEAVGHSFFTLSLGMGSLITYGSYLSRKDDIFAASATISGLDTTVALLACLMMFPLLFSAGMEPAAGPGLVFVSMPIAFGHMPGGYILGIVFFVLLLFAALTSSVSLLEVVAATVIDKFGVKRVRATVGTGVVVYLYGLLSAKHDLMLGDKNFFNSMDWAVSNIALPVGGLLIAVFVGWVAPRSLVEDEFNSARNWGRMFTGWLFLIRFVVPIAILLVFLSNLGLLGWLL